MLEGYAVRLEHSDLPEFPPNLASADSTFCVPCVSCSGFMGYLLSAKHPVPQYCLRSLSP